MRLALLQRSLAAVPNVLGRCLAAPTPVLRPQWLAYAAVEGRRYASVKSQGQYRYKSKRTHPKKLGAKRTGDQFVIPGNIIYKQRGTLWWPGENCIMGRDHTIHASATGYVKYYRDSNLHPDRKYIGVTFRKEDTLPYPLHAERKRRLAMDTFTITERAPEPEMSPSGIPTSITRRVDRAFAGEKATDKILRLRKDYSYREDNWRIGQLADTAAVRKRSRRSFLRRRRWVRERMIAGEKRAAEKRRQLEAEAGSEWDAQAAKLRAAAASQASRKKKAKKGPAKKR